MEEQGVYAERTTLRVILLALTAAATGILFIVLSNTWVFLQSYPGAQAVIKDLGSLMVASVAVAVLWELYARRAFLSEILSTTRLADEVKTTGLIGVSAKWRGEVNWPRLFNTASEMEIFFTYGSTWRNTYKEEIEAFARRKHTRATLLLPDPANAVVMAAIGQRTGMTADQLIARIKAAETDFINLFNVEGKAHEKLTIWHLPFVLSYSYYRFDNTAIFTLYHHRLDRQEVPTFLIEKGGSLFRFFEDEMNAFTGESNPRGVRIFP